MKPDVRINPKASENSPADTSPPPPVQTAASAEFVDAPPLSLASNAERLRLAYGEVEGVSVSLEDYTPNEVEVVDITARPKGRGLGTQAMTRLVGAADELGVDLMLLPVGNPGDKKHERLVEFYERFGFSSDEQGVMRRPASLAELVAASVPEIPNIAKQFVLGVKTLETECPTAHALIWISPALEAQIRLLAGFALEHDLYSLTAWDNEQEFVMGTDNASYVEQVLMVVTGWSVYWEGLFEGKPWETEAISFPVMHGAEPGSPQDLRKPTA